MSKQRRWIPVVAMAGSFLLGLTLLEGVLQIASHRTDAGLVILGKTLPHTQPIDERLATMIASYEAAPNPYLRYDAELGWSINPLATSSDGLYVSNAQGLRAPSQGVIYSTTTTSTLRIALFGDSFVHGDDVPWHESLAGHLERSFSEQEPEVEVLNFGVSGYGIDQALLRYREAGIYQPDVVVIGLQLENCLRNATLYRAFYSPNTGIPFAKPRFIVSEENELVLINTPTPEPALVPAAVRGFANSDLATYDFFYNLRAHTADTTLVLPQITHWALGNYHRAKQSRAALQPHHPVAQLCNAIVETFVREAKTESNVLVLFLPREVDFVTRLEHGSYPNQDLLTELAKTQDLVDPTDALLAAALRTPEEPLFNNHYTSTANRIIADQLSRAIIDAYGTRISESTSSNHKHISD